MKGVQDMRNNQMTFREYSLLKALVLFYIKNGTFTERERIELEMLYKKLHSQQMA